MSRFAGHARASQVDVVTGASVFRRRLALVAALPAVTGTAVALTQLLWVQVAAGVGSRVSPGWQRDLGTLVLVFASWTVVAAVCALPGWLAPHRARLRWSSTVLVLLMLVQEAATLCLTPFALPRVGLALTVLCLWGQARAGDRLIGAARAVPPFRT